MKYGRHWSQAEVDLVKEAISNWRYEGWNKNQCATFIMDRTEIPRTWSACYGKFQKMINYARHPEVFYTKETR